MVDRAGRYYSAQFKGFRRLTQREPLSPTIFNVVVYVFLRHLVTMVAAKEEAVQLGGTNTEGLGRDMHHLVAYLYSYNRLLALTREIYLQKPFDTRMYLFDRVSLLTNMVNTVSMACQPCSALGGQSTEAYGLRMIKEVLYVRYQLG